MQVEGWVVRQNINLCPFDRPNHPLTLPITLLLFQLQPDPIPLDEMTIDVGLPSNRFYVEDAAEEQSDSIIREVYAVADRAIEREAQSDKVNHWRLWLVLEDDEHSIVMDMIKTNAFDHVGFLGITLKDYKLSNFRTMEIKAMPKGALTLNKIVQHCKEKGLFRYKYSEDVTGCAFWVASIIESLENSNMIKKPDDTPYAELTVTEATKAAVSKVYRARGITIKESEASAGTWY